ncbi:hypothetical protein E4U34_007350 [Claviceps purpurea]|nr:hypothetical protein E4U34_007350 [Claviceps purpurea]
MVQNLSALPEGWEMEHGGVKPTCADAKVGVEMYAICVTIERFEASRYRRQRKREGERLQREQVLYRLACLSEILAATSVCGCTCTIESFASSTASEFSARETGEV